MQRQATEQLIPHQSFRRCTSLNLHQQYFYLSALCKLHHVRDSTLSMTNREYHQETMCNNQPCPRLSPLRINVAAATSNPLPCKHELSYYSPSTIKTPKTKGSESLPQTNRNNNGPRYYCKSLGWGSILREKRTCGSSSFSSTSSPSKSCLMLCTTFSS